MLRCWGYAMKTSILSLAVAGTLVTGLTVSAPLAQAKPGGCLKYGAAGAVAGHMVHHGVRGFVAVADFRPIQPAEQQRDQGAVPPGAAPAPGTGPT